jgi:hypothetical protein
MGCLTKLDAIHDSVGSTNMQGKAAVLALCVEVYRSIENVFRKEMAAVNRFQLRIGAAQEKGATGNPNAEIAAAGGPGAAGPGALGELAQDGDASRDPGGSRG